MPLNKTLEIKDDATLEGEKKNNNHKRTERMQEVLSWLVIMVLVVIALALVTVTAMYVYHLLKIEDWNTIKTLIFSIGSGITGYMLAYLKQVHGIDLGKN